MTISVTKLRGMTEELSEKLQQKGVKNSDQFLEATATPSQRRALAKELSIDEKVILQLANRADLSRIKGVAGVFSDLLEEAGVDTVKELATRRPENLHAKINEVNEQKKLAGRLPTLHDVEAWISEAKELPKTLSY